MLPHHPLSLLTHAIGKQLTVNHAGRNAVRGNYTCMLTNVVGSDVATSIVTDDCSELSTIVTF